MILVIHLNLLCLETIEQLEPVSLSKPLFLLLVELILSRSSLSSSDCLKGNSEIFELLLELPYLHDQKQITKMNSGLFKLKDELF